MKGGRNKAYLFITQEALKVAGDHIDVLVNNAGVYYPMSFDEGPNKGQGPLDGEFLQSASKISGQKFCRDDETSQSWANVKIGFFKTETTNCNLKTRNEERTRLQDSMK
jgi:NAD(P)-dependent dehydrogenase (short-subunit alcohol dehydrogenase family)